MRRKKITVEYGSTDQIQGEVKIPLYRIYVTDEVYYFPGGLRRPKANSWRLVTEQHVTREGQTVTLPDVKLEPTTDEGQPGPKLYTSVGVDREGRELWYGQDNEFLLPAELGPRCHFLDVIEYNEDLKAANAA